MRVWLELDHWYTIWNISKKDSGHVQVEVPDDLLERWEACKREFGEIQTAFDQLAPHVRGSRLGRIS